MKIARACISAVLKAVIPLLLAIAPALANADTLADVAGRYKIDASSRIGFVVEQIGGGGISGDFLGATEQLGELGGLLVVAWGAS